MTYCSYRNLPDNLTNAFKTGNAKEITNYLGQSTAINISGDEHNCNKVQAEQVLKNFFEKNAVKTFSLLFEGGKEPSKYSIGKLSTTKGEFRVNILFKSNIIVELRIEKDNGN
jgi:hypothetical protein